MVSNDRWHEAQSYEKSYWEKSAKRIEEGQSGDLSWYEWKAGWLKEKVEKAFPDNAIDFSEKIIIEVGSGPVGVISYLQGKEKYALDPLCDFYSTQQSLIKARVKDVDYMNVQGEKLPFDDAKFDFGILDNVIDHVLNADTVMNEMHRVLNKHGVLFFTVNLHPTFGYFMHRIISKLKIDRGHPHTFTKNKIEKFLNKHGFEILHSEHENYLDAKIKDLKSPSLKDKIKGVSGLSEYLYTCVAKKI